MKKITYGAIRKQMNGEAYTMQAVGRDAEVVAIAVNQGIDSHLEACFVPDRGDSYTKDGRRLRCVVSPESLPVLLRRLTEIEYTGRDGDDADVGGMLATDILGTLGFNVETMGYEIVK